MLEKIHQIQRTANNEYKVIKFIKNRNINQFLLKRHRNITTKIIFTSIKVCYPFQHLYDDDTSRAQYL